MTKKTDMAIADRDLMAYFDDELDEAEIEALEAQLAERQDARHKLDDMAFVGGVLREEIESDDRADGIADSVMAALEAQDDDDLDEDLDEVNLRSQKVPVTVAPANDNSRTVWTLAAAAAAVAAGMFVWGNTGQDAEPTAFAPTAQTVETSPTEAFEPAPETLGEVTAAPGGGSDEDEDAVEIAQLDFGEGEHTGSIFKVDNENTGVHTAVVWVTDTGEDE